MRLIDADALEEVVYDDLHYRAEIENEEFDLVINYLEAAPTIDPESLIQYHVDEIGCYDGGRVFERNGKYIDAVWCDGEYSWTYKTNIPHATFDVYECGEKYCRGIVFDIREVGATMAELKPCPFCGGEAEERFMKRKKLFSKFRFPYNTHYVYIRCKVCGAGTAVKCSSENAVEAWNRRADNAAD